VLPKYFKRMKAAGMAIPTLEEQATAKRKAAALMELEMEQTRAAKK
jgi:hypothetical protein